jgi:hypothetical protein
MDDFTVSGFQTSNPVMKKRRSITTRRPRQEPHSPEHSGFRKREIFLNAPPTSTPTADVVEGRSRQTTGGSQLATYRRGSSKHKESSSSRDNHSNSRGETNSAMQEKKVTKLKVKVGGVSHTIHQQKVH